MRQETHRLIRQRAANMRFIMASSASRENRTSITPPPRITASGSNRLMLVAMARAAW
jgi:hypothetical protein